MSHASRSIVTLLALGLGLASWPSVARADDPATREEPREEPTDPSIERDGRGLVFGAAAAFLATATPFDPAGSAGAEAAPLPAWAIRGRIGWEFPPGLAIALIAGGGGIVSANTHSNLTLRGLVEARYTLELDAVRPFASVALGLALVKTDTDLRPTFTSEASLGIELPLAPWAALEVSLGLEVMAPGDAWDDVLVLAILPQLGAGFRY